MKRVSVLLGALGTFVLATSMVFVQQPGAAAQDQAAPPQGGGRAGGPGGGPPPPTNLQVLPKDIPVPELNAAMQGIAGALGVQCNYCHVPPPPPPPGTAPPPAPAGGAAAGRGGRGGGAPQLDFAADDKQEKKTARVMMKMVDTINSTISGAAEFKSGTPLTKVECVTCHHNVAKPEQLTNVLSKMMLTKGEGSAVQRYREMRTQYYGSQSYDFTEPTLLRLGQQSLAANKPDDALAWLKLNMEFYPKSAPTLVTMSQAKVRKNDRNGAIKDLEEALKIQPDNMQAKRQLEQLKAAPAAK